MMSDTIYKELERLSEQLCDDNLTPAERLAVSDRMLELISQLPGGEEIVRRLARQAWEELRRGFH
ncbi:hypothetical protein D3C85_1857920 [compost metagenome]